MFGVIPDQASRVRVKICGITNENDAHAAIECGADALGFNFWPQRKRYIDIGKASRWIRELPNEVYKIAVLVDPTWEQALSIGGLPFIDGLQLHGGESADFCRRLAEQNIAFAKAVPVRDSTSLSDLPSFSTRTLVLDSAVDGFGGSGKPFRWKLARQFAEGHAGFRIILAGGLTAANVAQAIREVRPSGVDVSTGVELSPGSKDKELVEAFIAAARLAGT
jgi:phosphoribosylanthranilate isomerase